MTMIKCPDCAQQLSDKAAACPHCGAPPCVLNDDRHVPPSERRLIYTTLAAVAVVALVTTCSTFHTAPAGPAKALPSDLRPSARYVCREFIKQRGYSVENWGESYNWTVVTNSDGSHSVGARVFAAAPGDVPRNLYLTCMVTNSGDNWQLQSIARVR